KFVSDVDFADELIDYQKFMIKYPEVSCEEKIFDYDFPSYFEGILNSDKTELEKNQVNIVLDKKGFPLSWEDYARFVVWYGRKSGSNFYKFRKEVKQ
ncbi:MAG: hypothetical protein UH249_03785, partial [Acutalibacteraceae bacterium]|nr:hypothetical protein [Acutalibacteraceae bacterium]